MVRPAQALPLSDIIDIIRFRQELPLKEEDTKFLDNLYAMLITANFGSIFLLMLLYNVVSYYCFFLILFVFCLDLFVFCYDVLFDEKKRTSFVNDICFITNFFEKNRLLARLPKNV